MVGNESGELSRVEIEVCCSSRSRWAWERMLGWAESERVSCCGVVRCSVRGQTIGALILLLVLISSLSRFESLLGQHDATRFGHKE